MSVYTMRIYSHFAVLDIAYAVSFLFYFTMIILIVLCYELSFTLQRPAVTFVLVLQCQTLTERVAASL